MSLQQQGEYFGENGFVVIPGAIAPEELARLHADIIALNWQAREESIWASKAAAALVENASVIAALRACYGEIHCFKCVYVSAPPRDDSSGARRQPLHLDYGTEEFSGDARNLSPSWVNVGFYLSDLTPERGPLWVVPKSNHQYDLVPGSDLEHLDNAARMVLAKAGDAVLFHCFTAHAGGFNFSDSARQAIFFSFRPNWARLPGQASNWPQAAFLSATSERKKLLEG